MSQDLPAPSPATSSRVLILSMRNFDAYPSRSFLFELESCVCDFEQIDVIAPNFYPTMRNKITHKICRTIFKNTGKVPLISPTSNQFVLEQEYDLFLFICEFPEELYYLNSIKDWRKKCRKAVCWLDEIWAKNVHKAKHQLTVLKDFDHVFMNLSSSVKKVADIIQRPCSYMPPGIDAIKFCPYPIQPQRSIDVCSIGNRPASVHESLLNLANQDDFFYIVKKYSKYTYVLISNSDSIKINELLVGFIINKVSINNLIACNSRNKRIETISKNYKLSKNFFYYNSIFK